MLFRKRNVNSPSSGFFSQNNFSPRAKTYSADVIAGLHNIAGKHNTNGTSLLERCDLFDRFSKYILNT